MSSASSPPTAPACEDDGFLSPTHPRFLRYIVLCLVLILFGGIMSGLQQAVTQVSKAQLASMRRDGSPEERKVARLLEPIVQRRHLTLVCLLIGNALAMEALPVFMDNLVPKAMAILLSVTAVVVFSEILPQAVCLRYPLELAAFFSWLVYLLIGILYPIAAPIAFMLDVMFGEEHEQHLSKGGLRALAIEHGKRNKDGSSAILNKQELGVIVGALDLHKTKAIDVGTKLTDAFMISADDELRDDILIEILRSGHSRIPVYVGKDRTEICGLLLVKQLIRLRSVKVRDLDLLRPVLVARYDVSLFDLFSRFCRGESHMATIVMEDDTLDETGIRLCDPRKSGNINARNACGILTLEDVLEKMLQMDIRDETDEYKLVFNDIESRLGKIRTLKTTLLSGEEKGNSNGYGAIPGNEHGSKV